MEKLLTYETNFTKFYTDVLKCVKNAVDGLEKRWYFRLTNREHKK